ncbi:MAG: hypothetical protein GXP49_04395 [Deltaproteobacteria bacterium]|nr:hypothetical protein [Deltaproteobacteria bacterium]
MPKPDKIKSFTNLILILPGTLIILFSSIILFSGCGREPGIERARKLLRSGKPNKAVQILEAYVEGKNPDDSTRRLYIESLLEAGRPIAAASHYIEFFGLEENFEKKDSILQSRIALDIIRSMAESKTIPYERAVLEALSSAYLVSTWGKNPKKPAAELLDILKIMTRADDPGIRFSAACLLAKAGSDDGPGIFSELLGNSNGIPWTAISGCIDTNTFFSSRPIPGPIVEKLVRFALDHTDMLVQKSLCTSIIMNYPKMLVTFKNQFEKRGMFKTGTWRLVKSIIGSTADISINKEALSFLRGCLQDKIRMPPAAILLFDTMASRKMLPRALLEMGLSNPDYRIRTIALRSLGKSVCRIGSTMNSGVDLEHDPVFVIRVQAAGYCTRSPFDGHRAMLIDVALGNDFDAAELAVGILHELGDQRDGSIISSMLISEDDQVLLIGARTAFLVNDILIRRSLEPLLLGLDPRLRATAAVSLFLCLHN